MSARPKLGGVGVAITTMMIAHDSQRTSQKTANKLRIFVLGRFEVEQGHRLIESEQWRSGKARNLFKILLNRRNFQISRQEALELLWPELDQERAANNLNQAVYSLRRTLEPDLARAHESIYLKTEGAKIGLYPALIESIDLEDFRRLAQQAQQTCDLALYEAANALYLGDYLPEDLYEDWSISRRETLRQQWIDLMLHLADLCQGLGLNEKYQQTLHAILESDFANEEVAQRLMSSLTESGRREEALTFYHNFAAKLHNRLNMQPLSETRQLYQEIIAGKIATRPGGRRNGPRLEPVLPSGPIIRREAVWLLPTEARDQELIGRQVEQELWQTTLQRAKSGQGDLLLMVGEAGVGKTRLTQTLACDARRAGFDDLHLTGGPGQADLPFEGLYRLVEQALNLLSETDRSECLRYCGGAFLYRVLPGMARPVAELGATEDVFAATIHVLTWVGRTHRLALILDDLAALSDPALRLLRHWLRHPALGGLVVLGTARPGPGEGVELTHWLNQFDESRERVIWLARLSQPELEAMLTARLGLTLTADQLRWIGQASQGNPRLALELAQGQPLERWDGQPADLPPALTSYVRRLVSRLSQPAQTLLGLAALVGPSFSFEILRQIVTHRQDGAGWWIDLDPTRLGQSLTELTEAGLIEEYATSYRFAYPLLAQTLVTTAAHSQRQCWREVIEWAQQKSSSEPVARTAKIYDQV